MATLRQRVFESAKSTPRSIYDLVLSIALVVPDDHELSVSVHKCLDSLAFSPPESQSLHLMRLLVDFNNEFPEDQVLNSPWWVRVICILVNADGEASIELIESMNR